MEINNSIAGGVLHLLACDFYLFVLDSKHLWHTNPGKALYLSLLWVFVAGMIDHWMLLSENVQTLILAPPFIMIIALFAWGFWKKRNARQG